MNEKKRKIFNSITNIDEDILEEAQMVKSRRKSSSWKWFGVAAACFCIITAGAFAWKYFSTPQSNNNRIIVTEDGVVIPPMNVNLSSKVAADMVAFFIYEGRCYVQYDWIYDDVDILGEYLGTATGLIDEWTPKEGYVELAGSVKGDFYSVKGFDPTFMLCMKDADGTISTYICNTGITLKKGCDLYEERLHLSENYDAVQYETRKSWYNSEGEIYQLNDSKSEIVSDFISALNAAEFMPTDYVTNIISYEIYHVFFLVENGLSVHLRLYEGGYIRFQGILDVCVQIPSEQFEEIIQLFSEPNAGVLVR